MSDLSPPIPIAQFVSSARAATTWASEFDRARGYFDGPPVPPERGIEWLAAQLVERVRDKRDGVVVITGEEGSSKSSVAFHLTRACNRLTGNSWVPTDLCYSPEDVLEAYDAIRRGARPKATVVDYDEGSEGLLAGETFDPAQVVLIRILFRARIVGAILIIAIPDIHALAKKVRARRAAYWVDIETRGKAYEENPAPTVAAVFERDRTRHFKPTVALGLSRSLRCPVLTCPRPDLKDPSWIAWEARKMTDLGGSFVEWRTILKKRRERLFGPSGG